MGLIQMLDTVEDGLSDRVNISKIDGETMFLVDVPGLELPTCAWKLGWKQRS